MKKLFLILLVFQLSFSSLACDWSTIQRDGDQFVYSAECHDEVGKLVDASEERKKQIEKLEQTIELKDLALETSNERVELWKKTSYEVEDRALKYQKFTSLSKYAWFAAGILSVFASAYAFDKVGR